MARFKITVKDSNNPLHTLKVKTDCFIGVAQNEQRTGSHGFGYINCPGHIIMNAARANMEQIRSVLREVDPSDMMFKKIIVDMFEGEFEEEDSDES